MQNLGGKQSVLWAIGKQRMAYTFQRQRFFNQVYNCDDHPSFNSLGQMCKGTIKRETKNVQLDLQQ